MTTSFEFSSLLHAMAGEYHCRLAHNHRNDPRLFEFCGSLCPGGSRSLLPIRDMVAAAREEFPATKYRADTNLCTAHSKRRRLNKDSNLKEGLFLKAMAICDQRRSRIFNHAFLTVAALGERPP